MKPIFAYASGHESAMAWKAHFSQKAPWVDFQTWPDISDVEAVRYLATWKLPADIAATFPNLKVLFSVGAGIDQFDLSKLPEDLPIVRMIEPGISEGMAEYVTMAALALHRDLPGYLAKQRQQQWQPFYRSTLRWSRIGILGHGVLAQACLDKLKHFNFRLATWSRSHREVEGIQCFTGPKELGAFLSQTDILVCLLPLTSQTRKFLNEALLSQLPQGAALIHVGRGEQLDAGALLSALSSGALSSAVLDVTDPEPLPEGHALWLHPKIIVTPHIASVTNPETAIDQVLENLRNHAAGLPMLGLVDRRRGY